MCAELGTFAHPHSTAWGAYQRRVTSALRSALEQRGIHRERSPVTRKYGKWMQSKPEAHRSSGTSLTRTKRTDGCKRRECEKCEADDGPTLTRRLLQEFWRSTNSRSMIVDVEAARTCAAKASSSADINRQSLFVIHLPRTLQCHLVLRHLAALPHGRSLRVWIRLCFRRSVRDLLNDRRVNAADGINHCVSWSPEG